MNLILIFLSLFVSPNDNEVINELLRQLDIDSKNVEIRFYDSTTSPYNKSNKIGLLHFYSKSDSVYYDKHLDQVIMESKPLLIEFNAASLKIVRSASIPYIISNYVEAPWREPFINLNESIAQDIGFASCISVEVSHYTHSNDNSGYKRLIILKPEPSSWSIIFSEEISNYYHYRGIGCVGYLARGSDSLSVNQEFLIDGYHPLKVYHKKEKIITIENCIDTLISTIQLEEWTMINGQYKMTRIIGNKAVDIWDIEEEGWEDTAVKALNEFREKHGKE